MTELISIPLAKIILFLAALYAPGNTEEFEIHGPDTVETYIQEDGIWISKADPEEAYIISGHKLLSSSGLINLESEFGALDHDWSMESVLKLTSGVEVLKTREGLIIFPAGIAGDSKPIRVIYERTPIPRRRINKE